ncbi:MAG: ferrous iron transport protein B [Candidatus Omnitrophica bacterium]|nr:ferrous iron transport protein B [Candidatus Omnitrophota bacterium]
MKDIITIALAGNPNSGKSTVFNCLTGARQHVGNYPGVTVEKKEGRLSFQGYEIRVVDLPGIYSLSANSEDEIAAKDFLMGQGPDMIVDIIDSSNLERNLYLVTQLMELDIPLILVMNMSDLARQKGQSADYEALSSLLGVPIVTTVANKNTGTKALLEAIVDTYKGGPVLKPKGVDLGLDISVPIAELEELFGKDETLRARYPSRWLAVKMLEYDPLAVEAIKDMPQAARAKAIAEKGLRALKLSGTDSAETVIADRRYDFISKACSSLLNPSKGRKTDLSDRIDKIVLNRILGLPIFALVMYLIFKFTFTFSGPAVGWFEKFFEWLSSVASSVVPEGLIRSFVVDGIIAGVGGVLGFFPLVLFMFFAIAFFEDSGYMARAAFVMDKIMNKFGLHGKSFLPMMISTNGCAVPGIMAARTLDSKKDRLITMMVTPFMICGAKLPIFALFIGAFFAKEHGANIMFLMYSLSVIIAFGSAWILKKTVLKDQTAHFVMELPPYRIPTLRGLFLKMWERGWMYIKKAGSIILLISILIWAGFTFPRIEAKEGMDEEAAAAMQMEQSVAGRIGKFVQPVVQPLGMDWRGGVALIAGVAAKEVVVSTLGTIYSLGEVDPEDAEPLKESLQKDPSWSPLKALAFLMFSLIYLPCFVAMAVFYRESGSSWKWTSFLVFWTTVMAWVFAFIVYQLGRLLGF